MGQILLFLGDCSNRLVVHCWWRWAMHPAGKCNHLPMPDRPAQRIVVSGPYVQEPMVIPTLEARSGNTQFARQQSVQSYRTRIRKVESNPLPVPIRVWALCGNPFHSDQTGRINPNPYTVEQAEIERICPGGVTIILLKPLVQVSSDFLRSATRKNGTIPGGIAERAAIDEPHIDPPLMGIQTKLIAGRE